MNLDHMHHMHIPQGTVHAVPGGYGGACTCSTLDRIAPLLATWRWSETTDRMQFWKLSKAKK